MKSKYLLVMCIGLIVMMTGCSVGNIAFSRGMTDQAYIYIESVSKYPKHVQVTLDNRTTFRAKVHKPKKHQVKGHTYAVATGKRHVTVFDQRGVVFERTIMLSPQQTYRIVLP